MVRTKLCSLATIAIVVATHAAVPRSAEGADRGHAPASGAKVRISTAFFPGGVRDGRGRITGELIDYDGRYVRIRNVPGKAPLLIPHEAIGEFEAQRTGGLMRLKNIGAGAGVGATVGLLILMGHCNLPEGQVPSDPRCSDDAWAYGTLAKWVAVGTVIGALVPAKRWEPVYRENLRVAIAVGLTPKGGVGARVAVGF